MQKIHIDCVVTPRFKTPAVLEYFIFSFTADFGEVIQDLTAEAHHPISRKIERAAQCNPNLKGQVTRDGWGTIRANTLKDHLGYQDWHRKLDKTIIDWLEKNPTGTLDKFTAFMNKQYAEIAGSELYDEYCSDLETGNVEDLPAELDESCQEMIHASFTAESKAKKNPLNTALSHVCKAAMVVLAIFGATTVLVVSVDALRVPVLNFFLTQEERYTIISSDDSDVLMSRGNIDNIRSYLPKEYSIVYETYYGQGYYNLRYQNEAGNVISIRTGEGDVQLYASFTAHKREIPYFALPSAAGYSSPLDDMPYTMLDVMGLGEAHCAL